MLTVDGTTWNLFVHAVSCVYRSLYFEIPDHRMGLFPRIEHATVYVNGVWGIRISFKYWFSFALEFKIDQGEMKMKKDKECAY